MNLSMCFGLLYKRKKDLSWNRKQQTSGIDAETAFTSFVVSAMKRLEQATSRVLTVPEAMAHLRPYLRRDDPSVYLLDSHDETSAVRLDGKKAMWCSRSGRMVAPISIYDPIAGFRLIAWFYDFRKEVIDPRNFCAKG